jgi:ATP-binding cassette subfamily G (WHITE) protein 2 (PDR)
MAPTENAQGHPPAQHHNSAINDNTANMSPEETLHRRETGVAELARQLTRQSTRHGTHENLFDYEEGSELDPFSEKFNARRYVKGLASINKGTGAERTSGISYRDMSVHGFGTDAGT